MTRKIYSDENGNEMQFYINKDGKIYIQIIDPEEQMIGGYIVIEKEDAQELVDDFQLLISQL